MQRTDVQVVESLEAIDRRECFRENQKWKSGDRKCFAGIVIQELEFYFKCAVKHTKLCIPFLSKEVRYKPTDFQAHERGNANSHSRD